MELIEKMARAMCLQGGFDPDQVMPNDGRRWKYYVPQAQAALATIREHLLSGEVVERIEYIYCAGTQNNNFNPMLDALTAALEGQ